MIGKFEKIFLRRDLSGKFRREDAGCPTSEEDKSDRACWEGWRIPSFHFRIREWERNTASACHSEDCKRPRCDYCLPYQPDEEDINAERIKDDATMQIEKEFGTRATKEFNEMGMKMASAFAGGDVPQEDKDALFEILMTAYVTAKREAKEMYTPKSKRKDNRWFVRPIMSWEVT